MVTHPNTLGSQILIITRRNQRHNRMNLHSIVATHGNQQSRYHLDRDYVTPISHCGQNTWNNLVTTCIRYNLQKARRTPEETDMQLPAIPFTPTHTEYTNRRGPTFWPTRRGSWPPASRTPAHCASPGSEP